MSERHPPSLSVEMVLPSLVQAGMEMIVTRLALRLAERGHRVGITCLEEVGELATLLEGSAVNVALVRAPGLLSNLAAPSLERHLRQRAPTVVHTHSGGWLKGARAARASGVPRTIHTVHGLFHPEPWYGPVIMNRAALYTDVVVAVSQPIADYLRRVAPRTEDKVQVIENGVDTDRFAPDRTSSDHGVRHEDVRIGHVARLEPVKNQQLLLRAFRLVLNEFPRTTLRIAGTGSLRGDLGALAAELDLGDRLRFDGAVSDVASWLRDIDVLALTSDAEGTPMCILEAMASRVAVVSTAVGGIPAVLDHGSAGRLVFPGSVSAMAAALCELIANAQNRSLLAEAGLRRAHSLYSEERMVARYEEIYGAGVAAEPFTATVDACAG